MTDETGEASSTAPNTGPDDVPEAQICSAKGCARPAQWRLQWNNPKIHTPDRRKTWLACDDHKQSLSEFLDRRSFLREVEPLPD